MNWYTEYCKEHHIPVRYGKDRVWHEQRLKRMVNKAAALENEDLTGLTKEEAEAKLLARAEQMTVGMSGISLLLLQAVIGWIVRKLLDRWF
jgi:hypothetical protein